MKMCKKCLMMDTRPRLHFNERGVCAACEWSEIKKYKINWEERYKELENLCDTIRGKQQYDCIVPVSGGKDSTYVADKMKNEFGLNVLAVTIVPPLETELISNNLERFLEHGYDHIKVTPNVLIAQEINKRSFIEQGRPILSFTSCVQAVMFRFAVDFKIPLIMFGEEGETEYGGSTEMRYRPYFDADYAIKIYMEGNNLRDFMEGKFSEREMNLWMFPSKEKIREIGLKVGHWSYYENWDPYIHYEFARDNYGMQIPEERNVGTYTNFGQFDTPLYELHTYMMYLKFGFGRASQDACIDIRAGRLSREEAVKIVNEYDGEYPEKSIPLFLEYFKMSKDEFEAVIDKHANKELFEKINGVWQRKFEIK